MNAIISLCHFCENHGPSILFCTQAFHSVNTEDHLSQSTESTSSRDKDSVKNQQQCLTITSDSEKGDSRPNSIDSEPEDHQNQVESSRKYTSTSSNSTPKAKCEVSKPGKWNGPLSLLIHHICVRSSI